MSNHPTFYLPGPVVISRIPGTVPIVNAALSTAGKALLGSALTLCLIALSAPQSSSSLVSSPATGAALVTGVSTPIFEDSISGDDHVDYQVVTPSGTFTLNTPQPADATLTGVVSDGTFTTLSAFPKALSAPPNPGALIVHTVNIAVVTPKGGTPLSSAALDDLKAYFTSIVNGPVSTYWSTVTSSRVKFQMGAFTAFTSTTLASDVCLGYQKVEAESAQQLGGYAASKHLISFVPSVSCSYAGRGSVGSTDFLGGGQIILPNYKQASVMSHELGHNLGLWHSNYQNCFSSPALADGPGESCTVAEYADSTDIMGGSSSSSNTTTSGMLNPVHLDSLGILSDLTPGTFTTDGQAITLSPIASASGVRTATYVAPSGDKYFLEFRAPVGIDAPFVGRKYQADSGPGVFLTKKNNVALLALQADKSRFQIAGSTKLLAPGNMSTDDMWQKSPTLPLNVPVPLTDGHESFTLTSMTASAATVIFHSRTTNPTSPSFTSSVALPRGLVTLAGSRVSLPLTVSWNQVTDAYTRIISQTLNGRGVPASQRSLSSLPTPTSSGVSSTSPFSLSGIDSLGHAGAFSGNAVETYVDDGGRASVKYSAGWVVTKSSATIGGFAHTSTKVNASVTLLLPSSSYALLFDTSKVAGTVKVLVDGKAYPVFSVKTSTARRGNALFAVSLPYGNHKVVIQVVSGKAVFEGVVLAR